MRSISLMDSMSAAPIRRRPAASVCRRRGPARLSFPQESTGGCSVPPVEVPHDRFLRARLDVIDRGAGQVRVVPDRYSEPPRAGLGLDQLHKPIPPLDRRPR